VSAASAAHTIRTSRCFSFSDRLYNFIGLESASDINPKLKSKCASLDDKTTLV
jgi:peroxidase